MRKLLAVALAIGVPACGDNTPTMPAAAPPTTLPPRSIVQVVANPNPVVAGPPGTSTDGINYPFSARFSIAISETAGLACNVNRISILFPGTNNTIPYGVADVQRMAGSNFVAASGSLSVPFSLVYGPNRQQPLLVTVEVIDANRNTVTGTVTVQLV